MSALKPGDSIVPFTLPGTDNNTHSLTDFADKSVIVIIFSCNHCPYVQAWEDRMIEIQSDYDDDGVQLIAINANDAKQLPDDSQAKMKERARCKDFNFPYVYDETQSIARAYGAERTPEVFVFDAHHVLRYHGAIDDNFREPNEVKKHYLRNALDSILAGDVPQMIETRSVGCPIKWK